MFKNLHELIKQMPDEATCRGYLASQRWQDGIVVCPYCGNRGAYNIEKGKRYKCKSSACYKKFSCITGTVFEASNLPVSKILHAVYVLTAHKKGISSYQLAKDIGCTQRSAWFLMHRIREAVKEKAPAMLEGAIEVDETYMSRKYRSDFKGLPPDKADAMLERSKKNKGVVVGMAQKDKGIAVIAIPSRDAKMIRSEIYDRIKEGATIYTDEANLYWRGLEKYNHESVSHSKREWVRGSVTVNHVENFWSVMKRGIHGIYHQISFKHLQRYCDEYSYRYNNRKMSDKERFVITLQNITGRLTYNRLIHGEESQSNKKA